MTPSSPPIVDLAAVAKTLLAFRARWVTPAVVLTAVALAYALLRPPTWQISQALVVRDEAIGNLSRPGRFDDPEWMKTAQETVLELAKSRSVVSAALAEVGPRPGRAGKRAWPTADEIQKAQRSIKVTAPRGAEFGRTEVFYLKVKGSDKDWTVAFTKALCRQLDAQLEELRDRKARSLVDELTKTVALARADLDEATARLAAQEQEVGSDLAELRILNESASGDSSLRQTLIEVRNELRQAKRDRQANQQLLEMLTIARRDPGQLLATPNRLLQSQPALRQLKDGLVAAKLQTARLLGELSEHHPKVKAARAAQEEIRLHLHRELGSAVAGLQAELRIDAARVGQLQTQRAELENRMNRLAAVRAGYGNLVSEVRQRSQILSMAEKDLAEARASRAAAHAASLMTLLGGPESGNAPIGPSRATLVLWGLLGGLLTGWGWVFLTVPVPSPAAAPGAVRPASASQSPCKDPANGRPRGLSLKQALAQICQFTPSWN